MNKLEELKARLTQIKATISGLGDSDADIEKMEELNDEGKKVMAKIKALEARDELMASSEMSAGRKAPAAAPAAKANPHIQVGEESKDPKAGFSSGGEFFATVRKSAMTGRPDDRLVKLNAGLMERNGEDGGFLVPDDFRTEIERKVQGEDSLLPMTRQIITNSNSVHIPTIETAPWDGTGIQAFWEGERTPHKYTEGIFGSDSLKLHKLTAAVRVTEELLEDAPALESYLNMMAPEALIYKINSAIIYGDGVGKPQGFLNAPAGIIVPKEASQLPDTINFANINNMYARMNPAAAGRSMWLVNVAVLPQLNLLTYPDGSPAYSPAGGASAAPYGTLFGRPIKPMLSGMKQLGDRGDIVLWDPQSYITATKSSGIKSSSSVHVFWNTDEVAFKFQMRVAGQTLFKAPTKAEFGDFTVSGVVSLADRA